MIDGYVEKPTGELVIPDTLGGYPVTAISGDAFRNCTGLTSVTIPEGVTSIGGSAFSGCTGLTNVTIPEGVTIIGGGAFYGCTSLTSVTIPDSVTTIGATAFSGTALYKDESNWEDGALYIGNALIEVGKGLTGNFVVKKDTRVVADNAFYDCTRLTSVTIPVSLTSIGNSAFYGAAD